MLAVFAAPKNEKEDLRSGLLHDDFCQMSVRWFITGHSTHKTGELQRLEGIKEECTGAFRMRITLAEIGKSSTGKSSSSF